MTAVPIIWLSMHEGIDSRGPFDTGLLEDLFADELWPLGLEVDHYVVEHPRVDNLLGFWNLGHAVVVLPARHHASVADVAELNRILGTLPGVVLILVGDEEAIFPWRELNHPNMKLWVMIPRPDVHGELKGSAFFFGDGYPPGTRAMLNTAPELTRDIPWVFIGQVTHERRKQAAYGLRRLSETLSGSLIETPGFTQGLQRLDYLRLLQQSKVAPCPSGPCTVDTFRLYEALEAGCLPIADVFTPDDRTGYWEMVYDAMPVPQICNWEDIGEFVEELTSDWARQASVAGAWWRQRKVEMARRLMTDLSDIGFGEAPREAMCTALVTTSPTTKSPEAQMEMFEQTLGSIPVGMPAVIACDGVRTEQLELTGQYYEYVHQVVQLAQRTPNVNVIVADHHYHQAGLTRLALQQVHSPTLLFMEHDTPMSWESIDWDACINLVKYGPIDMLRFHHEAQVHPEHEHLMIDRETEIVDGVPIRRTMQWSQRPHIAKTAYYRSILGRYFTAGGSSFIEDRLHGAAQDDPKDHRLAIYHPEGTIRRSIHTDGRGGAPKYDELQRF